MPVKEKHEVLVGDIRNDLRNMREMVIGSGDISRLNECNFRKLFGMYKNLPQQVVFVRKIYIEAIQEVLAFLSKGCVTEAMVNICILDEVFESQGRNVDMEMSLESVEAINQHIHGIRKKKNDEIVLEGVRSWNCLKKKKAIRICITPFPDDDQTLMSIEQELDSMSRVLGRWGEPKDTNHTD